MASGASINLITWNPRYSVGIARIDTEHQVLINLVNEVRRLLDRAS